MSQKKNKVQRCATCQGVFPPVFLDEEGRCGSCRNTKKVEEPELFKELPPEEESSLPEPAPERPTEAKQAAAREMAKRQLARNRLIVFIQSFMPDYMAGWFHLDLARRLEQFYADVEAKKSPRLAIFVPPRHGKTQLTSKASPAWAMGQHPDWEFIVCSYSSTLANRISRDIRTTMRDPYYHALFPDVALNPDVQAVDLWETMQGGGVLAAGVGGPITGSGAHVLLIDDPVKNREEADSPTTREGIFDWYTSTAYTRLAPGGGVLIIQCMTGDTLVMLADGAERRLDQLMPGDSVATFGEDGRCDVSQVVNWASSGYDRCLTIRTTSGREVRANGRHPFAVIRDGELQWVRARDLRVTDQLVSLGDTGRERLAKKKGASYRPSAKGGAQATTTNTAGQRAIDLLQLMRKAAGKPTLSIGTGSIKRSMTAWLKNKTANVPYAVSRLLRRILGRTGTEFFALTTAMTPGRLEDSSATTVTLWLDTPKRPLPLKQLPPTSDFMPETIDSITDCGVHEVFDIEVAGTENFIACGLVSGNTRWHEDDLAGRLVQAMADGEGDVFEVVEYPAIAVKDEQFRRKGEALHPERYDLNALKRIKKVLPDRDWWALYQQQPIPDGGAFFTKQMFEFYYPDDLPEDLNNYSAWDLAVGEKEMNDWTVGLTAGMDEHGKLWLLDRVKGRIGGLKIVEALLDNHVKWNELVVGVEKGQIQMAIAPFLERMQAERRQWGFHYEPLNPGRRDKVARARPIQAMCQNGMVMIPHPSTAPWVEDFIAELLRFPHGTHDDDVDAFAWLGQMLTEMSVTYKPPPPKKKSWKDRLDRFITQSETGEHKGHMSA